MTTRGPHELWYDQKTSSWRQHAPNSPSTQSAEDEFFAEDDVTVPACSVDELHDSLKGLTARQRFVIELRFGMKDGYCYSQLEIAEMSGWSLATVQEHEHRAKQGIYKTITGKVRRKYPVDGSPTRRATGS